jgi:hypothetical protein
MERKLWRPWRPYTPGFPCLVIIAVMLGVLALIGLLALLPGVVSGGLIVLALGFGLAIFNYKTAFPDRKRARTLVRLFESMVTTLGLLGAFAGIFLRDSAWIMLMFLPFVLNLVIVNWRHAIWGTIGGTSPAFYRRQEQRLQRAMHYVGEHGVITIPVYCQLTDVPQEMARSDLEVLVRREVLRATGNPQTGQYWVP